MTRYAIYHLPEGSLGDLGSAWLGWDARRGLVPPRPAELPPDGAALTSTPMRYGFHATLKAPFRLCEGSSAAELAQEAEAICTGLAPFAMPLRLYCDWGFVMLRPEVQPRALHDLERALVTGLDRFRAPLRPEDRARRRPESLSDEARAHLDQWGYPFVLDLFNYHLTLSNGLHAPAAEALMADLAPAFGPLIAAPMPVRSVALLAENADGRLQMIAEFPLRG